MKRLAFILALIISFTMGATAQPKQLSKEDKERFFNAKAQIMQQKLELTEGQMKDFLEVYKQYQEDIVKIKHPKRTHVNAEELTSDEAYNDVVGHLQFMKSILDVQEKYIGKLKPILTPIQLKRFLKVENNVQKYIRDHKNGRKARLDSLQNCPRGDVKFERMPMREGDKPFGTERKIPREPKKTLYNRE